MLDELRSKIPDYAKDLRLNLSTVLSVDHESQLKETQILGIALACAYAIKNPFLLHQIEKETKNILEDATLQGIKAATSIMAMNNVYYRFIHLVSDKEYGQLPAKLRMNILTNPGIEKVDFELFSLAVSAINGCGLCMDSHTRTLSQQGLNKVSIQHAVRIAAVLNAAAQVIQQENIRGE